LAAGERPADEHLQLGFRAGELLGQHVGLGEPREQDLAVGVTVAVVGDEDRTVRGLKAVGIRNASITNARNTNASAKAVISPSNVLAISAARLLDFVSISFAINFQQISPLSGIKGTIMRPTPCRVNYNCAAVSTITAAIRGPAAKAILKLRLLVNCSSCAF
jgi:hypothetical protein